jgi:3-deoxy-D-manno-octulosonic-acid transferase
MYTLYNILLLILSPYIAVFFAWRVFVSGKSRHAWRQQLGMLPKDICRNSGNPRIWIHAVSVGEAVASAPIIREIKAAVPDVEIIVSTTTTTGQEMARKAIPEADHFIYFPLDVPPFIQRALDTVEPDIFVGVESEIWPNFIATAFAERIPIMIVNGIVSDKTYNRGMKVWSFYKWVLSGVHRFLMQSKEDAKRIIDLGAMATRVEVVGNCKFDQESDLLTDEQLKDIRRKFGVSEGTLVFVAGSTNLGEDQPVLDAFGIARETHRNLKLILAPRQIERAESIQEMARARGFVCSRRSEPDAITGSEDIVILDTFGELASIYGICDVAFVGGNFIPKGGHNILQPIAQGKPVFFGPYTFKSRDLVRQAKSAGVGFEVRDGKDLGEKISAMLSDKRKLEDVKRMALEMIRANRGASKRCAESIAQVLVNRMRA